MIDIVYQILLTLVNKENQGYVSPTEFNLLANNVQSEIFRGYFDDANRDKNKTSQGLSNRGYGNLDFNQRQLIQQFAAISIALPATAGVVTLPSDIYFIEDNGIVSGTNETYPSRVIDEAPRGTFGYLGLSDASPTGLYPVYERYGSTIKILPISIDTVDLRYLRTPATPKWTYTTVSNQPMYNAGDVAHQDFELHNSELVNIVLKMLTYFGINLREVEVVQAAELMKDKLNLKENN